MMSSAIRRMSTVALKKAKPMAEAVREDLVLVNIRWRAQEKGWRTRYTIPKEMNWALKVEGKPESEFVTQEDVDRGVYVELHASKDDKVVDMLNRFGKGNLKPKFMTNQAATKWDVKIDHAYHRFSHEIPQEMTIKEIMDLIEEKEGEAETGGKAEENEVEKGGEAEEEGEAEAEAEADAKAGKQIPVVNLFMEWK